MSLKFLSIQFLSLIFLFYGSSCSTFAVDGSESVLLVDIVKPECIKLDVKKFEAPPISVFSKENFKDKLLQAAKNYGVKITADRLTVDYEKSEILISSLAFKASYYACRPVENISDYSLEQSCENQNEVRSCVALATIHQSRGNHARMMNYFRKSCQLSDKNSCDWITKFNIKKDKLKRSCILKSGEACFAAAKIADVDRDFSLMMTFLKQGCSYGHSESCFYQNYAQEEKNRTSELAAREREDENRRYQQYMIDLQQDILNQQAIAQTMNALNQIPKGFYCTSQKDGFGGSTTQCH